MNTTTTKETGMKTFDIPKSVEMFGKSWAVAYALTNLNWHHSDQEHDDWCSFGGYDLNLYVCDGQLVVTVFALVDDGSGFMTTDTNIYKTVFQHQHKKLTQ